MIVQEKQLIPEYQTDTPPMLPTTYGWGRMITIGLGVLSIGFAIAFIGFMFGQRNSVKEIQGSFSPTPTIKSISHGLQYQGKDYSFVYPQGWGTLALSSESLIISPQATIAKYRPLVMSGESIGGGKDWVITISQTPEGPTNTIAYVSNEQQHVTAQPITVNNVPATAYTISVLQEGQMHKRGDIYEVVVLIYNGKIWQFVLANMEYQSTFTQLLSTVVFTPSSLSLTPSPTQVTYIDANFGYRITYPVSWIFRQTYSNSIAKQAPTDILSGFDLTYNTTIGGKSYTQATIVGNVLDAHRISDVQTWISQYDPNYPQQATKTVTTFAGYPAIVYTSMDGQQKYIYVIAGKYAYRISYKEAAGISTLTQSIVNSFTP